MHDISLGHTIRDYLTGEEVEATTYEDLRQALARMLVEERGYPAEQLKPRVPVCFPVDGKEYSRLVDYVAYDLSGRPLLVLLFCSGACTTYEREAVASARLVEGGPAPLAAVTDSKDAVLVDTAEGRRLGEGMRALPQWDDLQRLAAAHPVGPYGAERLQKERRLLYMYSESLYDCCSHATCAVEARGGRWKK